MFFKAMGPEGFQRATGKPFGRLRRGGIPLYPLFRRKQNFFYETRYFL